MKEGLNVLFGLAGGLALFLFGMQSMSDALQKAAGTRMKQVLEALTRNPVMGVLAGALVTAVLQSSSATTVMVIGFVSAGLMSLPQGISVIFGANIGTTMTAQLLAFQISDYIYPIIFVGFLLHFLGRSGQAKGVGMVLFSFGLLFEGIEIMGGVMKPLAGSPLFIDLMGKVMDVPVLGVFLGAGMTLVVQSSSATIAVLQSFAEQAGPDGVSSVMGLAGAIPILLGDNIGTTITALLASLGQSKNARRTAVAHSVFNITGSAVFLFLIPWFSQFIVWISPKGPEVEVIARQIANAHTVFNLCTTLIWLPLLPLMVKLVHMIVPGQDALPSTEGEPRSLNWDVLGQPVAALYLASQEIGRCAALVDGMLVRAGESFLEPDGPLRSEGVLLTGDSVRALHGHIVRYISALFSGGGLTEEQSAATAGLLAVSNQISRVSERTAEIVAFAGPEKGGLPLSETARQELGACFTAAQGMFRRAVQAVETGQEHWAEEVLRDKEGLKEAEKALNKSHLARVRDKTCSPELTLAFSDILYALDRIGDHCGAMAEEALGGVAFAKLREGPETEERRETA